MAGSILVLEMDCWEPLGPDLLAQARDREVEIVAFDPLTASLLADHGASFRTLESSAPEWTWEEANQQLFDLLSRSAASSATRDLLDTFAHYLIFEMNLLFDRLCRIRALTDRERPELLIVGVSRPGSLADQLYAVAAELPWIADVRRWPVGDAPLPSHLAG